MLPFFEEDDGINDKVKDYCHITGKSCGAAHFSSNLKVKRNSSSISPIALHDMINYDLFIKGLNDRKDQNVNLEVFPQIVEDLYPFLFVD